MTIDRDLFIKTLRDMTWHEEYRAREVGISTSTVARMMIEQNKTAMEVINDVVEDLYPGATK